MSAPAELLSVVSSYFIRHQPVVKVDVPMEVMAPISEVIKEQTAFQLGKALGCKLTSNTWGAAKWTCLSLCSASKFTFHFVANNTKSAVMNTVYIEGHPYRSALLCVSAGYATYCATSFLYKKIRSRRPKVVAAPVQEDPINGIPVEDVLGLDEEVEPLVPVKPQSDVKAWFSKTPANQVPLTVSYPSTSFSGESLIEGSEERDMQHRKGEVLIGVKDALIGKGCRLYNFLVFPEHVYTAAKSKSTRLMISNPNNQRHVFLDTEKMGNQVRLIALDVVAILLEESAWANLAIAKTNINPLAEKRSVSITGVMGRGTIGVLENNFAAGFGLTIYRASTTKGYSGALYVDGERALAMHLWGGASGNVGIAVGFLKLLLVGRARKNEGVDNDSSISWLVNTVYNGDRLRKGVKVERNQDEVRVFYNGLYHVIDNDDIRRGLNDTQIQALNYQGDGEAGHFLVCQSHGASSTVGSSEACQRGPDTTGMNKSCEPLKESLVSASQDTTSQNQDNKKKRALEEIQKFVNVMLDINQANTSPSQ
uniref:Uncharacterized protein n=1 Tax=Soybean thrips sobemo-like virus 10 TaxID=2803988 RepID=A0A7T8IMM2_9VIRU|nr:hypothetical protein [Soybean thrips sobemo-like virus 10]